MPRFQGQRSLQTAYGYGLFLLQNRFSVITWFCNSVPPFHSFLFEFQSSMLLIPITKRPQYASQVIKHLEISTVFHDQGPVSRNGPDN